MRTLPTGRRSGSPDGAGGGSGLRLECIIGDAEDCLRAVGTVFASFCQQDSGCRAYGVAVEGQRFFVKVAVNERAVLSLRRAQALHQSVSHDAIIPLVESIPTDAAGLALVYPWVDGEGLYGARVAGTVRRQDPSGARARFRSLPVPEVLAAVDAIFDAHLAVVRAGFVAVDLYDGSFIYDFTARRMRLCDLDEYRPGPFVVETDRLPGSRRFMAPEELARGSVIDERTTVFNLGRTALVLLDEGDLDGRFRGTPAALVVIHRATSSERHRRHPTVEELVSAWRHAVPGIGLEP